MWGVIKWLISYIVGGISFNLILVGAAWWLTFTYGSKPIGDYDLHKRDRMRLEEEALKEEAKRGGPSDSQSSIDGWLTIRRQFDAPQPHGGQGQILTNNLPDAIDNVNDHHNPSKLSYSTRIAQTYRTIRGTAAKANLPPQDMYWVSLKGGLLFIYQLTPEGKEKCTVGVTVPTQEHLEAIVALHLERYNLTIESKHGSAGLTEGKLFSKRTALVLRLVDTKSNKKDGFAMIAKGMSNSDNSMTIDEEIAPWFIHSKSPVKTEDWYLKLVAKTHGRPTYSRVWSEEHMLWFMNTVHSTDKEDPSNLDWLNAFIGRIFLGITHTSLVEQGIITRINRKLALISHPLIGPLVATEVNLGHIPPTFSRVQLKDLMGNGTVSFHAHMDYRQPAGLEGNGIRITIEATKLGFKAVLAVIIKSLSGDVQVKIKAPPSDRIWWAFTKAPKMDMVIEPILGSRQINWNFILGFIEKKMREGIAESVVLPNMDDVPFFNTTDLPVRGGIFDSASKYTEKVEENVAEDSASIKSNQSNKSEKSAKSNKSAHTINNASTSATTTSAKPEGLRYRNKNSDATSPAINEDAVPEKHAIVRADTSPTLVASSSSRKAPSSFKMFTSRPSSVRNDSAATTTTGTNTAAVSDRPISDTPRTMSVDSSASRGFDLQASASVESPSLQSSTRQGSTASLPPPVHSSFIQGSTASIPETSGTSVTPRSLTPHEKDGLTREVDPSDPPHDMGLNKVTTASLMTAVRARDKAGLHTQANVAREGIKKWGVNFVNKRRTKLDEAEQGGAHPHQPASSYYAPSADEGMPINQPRTSLQERLAAAAAKRESMASQNSNPAAVASSTSQDSLASPASAGISREATPMTAPPRPPAGSAKDVLGTSPPSAAPPPAARMVVPSVPKRAGVVTAIGHNPTSTSADALDHASGAIQADETPRSASAPAEENRDKAQTPLPEITAASVTTRTASGEKGAGTSPARQSLLGYYKHGSASSTNSNGTSNANGNEEA